MGETGGWQRSSGGWGNTGEVCQKVEISSYKISPGDIEYMMETIGTTAAAAKSLQSCPTLCDPIDGSLPGSSIPGILQARTLE